jgi:PAS domain S-box-containing protein
MLTDRPVGLGSSENLAKFGRTRSEREVKNFDATLLGSVDTAVIATDLAGCIIYWNQAAERLYGWSFSEVHGRNFLDIVPAAESRASSSEVFEQLRKGERLSSTEFTARHKDGRWFSAHLSGSLVRDEEGELIAIVGVSLDSSTIGRDTTPAGFSSVVMRKLKQLSTAPTVWRGRSEWARLLTGFGIAAILYIAAVEGRLLLDEVIADRFPFLTLWPAVLLAAFFCGFWPTLVLLIAAAGTGAFWAALPGQSISMQILDVSLFILTAVILITPIFYSLAVQRRLKRQDEQMALINAELKHRIRNLFAVTSSICLQTLRSKIPREDAGKAIIGRIQALSAAQELLTISAEGSDLRALLKVVLLPLSPSASRLVMEGPTVTLAKETITSFVLILHELGTNALKYGAWKVGVEGVISVRWQILEAGELDFHWRETGVSLFLPPVREGLGSELIKRGLRDAVVRHEIKPDGVDCRIRLKL